METHYEVVQRLMAPHRKDAKEACDIGIGPAQVKNQWLQTAILDEYLRREVKVPDRLTQPWSLIDVFNTPSAQKTSMAMYAQGVSEGTIMSYLTIAWNMVAFSLDGEKTYEVSPGLAEHLASTDVKNVKCEHLRLPFRSIYVVVPPSAGLVIPGRVSGAISQEIEAVTGAPLGSFGESVRVRGMYLNEITTPNGRGWSLSVVADGDPAAGGKDWTFYTFEQPLFDGKTVEEAMNWRGFVVSNPEFKRRYRADEVWESYFLWAMNLCLYLTYEPGVEVVEYWANKEAEALARKVKRLNGEERRRAKTRLRSMSPQRRLYVGKDIPLLKDTAEAHPSREGKPLNHRVLVQGHWRNQAFGTGFQEHKMVWIRPHMRGPKGTPEENPRRIVT